MTRAPLRNRFVALALCGFALLPAGTASAEEPIEAALRQWVSALDASPNWVAGFGELTYDPLMQTATVKNFTIRSETMATKLEISFGTIMITGYSEGPDGAFSATEIRATDNRVIAGDVLDGTIADIDAKGLAVPSFRDFVFDPARMFSSLVKAMSIATSTRLDQLDVSKVVIDQTYEGQQSRSTIDSYHLSGMKDGKLDLATVSGLKQESPSPDSLVKMQIESIEARKYNLNALLMVLDPEGHSSDGSWQTLLALETYRNWSMTIPGGEMRIGAFEMENMKARKPAKNFAPFLDALLANPKMPEDDLAKLSIDYLPSLFSWFGVDAFRLTDVDVVAPEIERFHFGDFHINDLSSDGLGELGFGNLDVSVQDKGSFGAERLAIGGFRFPSLDKITAAIRASEAGLEADPLPLIPTLGYGEAVNVDLVQTGKKLGSIDRARFDLSDYIGPVPTKIALDLRGLDLDLSLVDDPKARQMIEGLGYDRLQADYGFKINWREADESVNLSDFKLAIKDVGSITADIMLTGLTRATIEDPKSLEAALPSLLFSRGKVVVQDNSVVDRAIGMEAKKKNQTPEKFREDIAGALPLTLMLVLKNPTFQQKLAPALQAFIRTPGALTLTAAPVPPVPVLAILQAAESNPRSLPNLISLEVQADKPSAN